MDEHFSSIPSDKYAYELTEEAGALKPAMRVGAIAVKIVLLAAAGIFGLSTIFQRSNNRAQRVNT